MTKVLANRLSRLETALNITPEDEADDGYEVLTAERCERGHRALVCLTMTHPPTPWRAAQLARIRAEYIPGPKRVRRLRQATQEQHDRLMATCPYDRDELAAEAARDFLWCMA